jgi:hypothetical protein
MTSTSCAKGYVRCGLAPAKCKILSDRIEAEGPPSTIVSGYDLRQLGWTLVTQRRRRIVPDDQKILADGTLQSLERDGLRIVR